MNKFHQTTTCNESPLNIIQGTYSYHQFLICLHKKKTSECFLKFYSSLMIKKTCMGLWASFPMRWRVVERVGKMAKTPTCHLHVAYMSPTCCLHISFTSKSMMWQIVIKLDKRNVLGILKGSNSSLVTSRMNRINSQKKNSCNSKLRISQSLHHNLSEQPAWHSG